MARGKDLAALAGLAGLAYAMSNKKGDEAAPKGKEDTGPGYKSTETRLERPEDTIKRSTAKAPGDSKPITESNVTTSEKAAAVSPAPPKPAAKSPVSAADEDTTAPTKPLDTPAQRTDQLANLSRAVNREDKTKKYAQNEFRDVTRTYTKRDGTPAVKAQETYDTLDKKAGAATGSAFKTDALKVASRAAAVADAKRRAAKQSSYKKGGMVTKVSSASKRADGIASRGKTKCKMY